jgi:acyl-CoA reductase-like NAD-dependent aldehyde dehydrogenase
MKELACFAGGRWTRPNGPVIEVRNPATAGEVIATVPAFGPAEMSAAMAGTRDAFASWSARPPVARAEVLRGAAEALDRRAEEIARDLVAENGKPIREARGEIAKSVATFRYYAGLAGALDGRAFAGGREHLRHETRLEPVGPVVAITPWNVPAAGPARKLAPALLAGNPVILKPASATPVTAIHLVECLLEAGVESGAVQLLCGRGETAGRSLSASPFAAAVSFTGSTEVGLQLQRALSGSLTRLQLELGGKNAALVFPDADLDSAVRYIIEAAYASAGQQCTATSRVLAQQEIYCEVIDRLVDQVRRLRVGDPADESTQIGPLISDAQLQTVSGFVERAVREGASVSAGGARISRPGCFYEPTVLVAVQPHMEVAQEEVFGPVLSVLPFNSLEEAIEILNDTTYGLSCAVHTRSLRVAQVVAAKADCGVVVVNGPTAGIELPAPFGGFKMSGAPWKEHGPESLQFYTRTKLVSWGWE